jgi:hypothetical protein
VLGADQPEVLPEHLEQGLVHDDERLATLTVHGQADARLHRLPRRLEINRG